MSECRPCHAKATGRAAETKGRQGVHPTPCRAPSAAPATQKPPAEQRRPKDAQGVHLTPCRAPSAAPATQEPAETKGHQGVHRTPCRAPSAAPATQKPPAEQRRPRDARAYIGPLAEHQVLRLTTQKPPADAAETKGRQGVQRTPCRAPTCCACHAKASGRAPETKGRQGVHPTLRPLAEHQVPRLPRKSHRQSSGDQGTPGRTSDPLQSTKCCACHAKASGRAPETKGRQGVHPTPCGAPSAAPAMQKPPAEQRRPRDARAYIGPLAEHQVPRRLRKSHRRSSGDQGTARAYIGPLAEHQVLRLPRQSHRQSSVHRTPCRAPSAAPVTQKPPAEDQGTPGRTSDTLQSTKCCACHATLAEHQVLCLPRKNPPAEQRRPRDARAYIRPLAEHQVLRLPRKSHLAEHQVLGLPHKSHRQSSGDQGTPGRTSDPLTVHIVPRLPRKSHRQTSGDQGRQRVHPTPCRAPSAAPATQKPPAEQRRPRDARAYIRPLAEHQVLRLPRKSQRQSTGDQGTPGRTSDPLQSTKCCACHAKATGRAAETKGRQGVHPTPCRAPSAAPATQKPPAEQRRPRDARAYIRPLAEHQVLRVSVSELSE